MKNDIDEMLNLTADIAEALLAIKDNDGAVSHELCAKIDRLAELSASNADENAALTERIESVTEKIIRDRAEEITEGADAPFETERDETDALIEDARRKAMESEDDGISEGCCGEEHARESMAEAAEFEERADADEAAPEAMPYSGTGLTGKQLRGIFSLNDIFLYQRTLFGGSSERFNASLDEIAHLSTTEELKAFLSEKCNINLKSREAKDFMVSLSQFFPS